jgi:hypothetical protein
MHLAIGKHSKFHNSCCQSASAQLNSEILGKVWNTASKKACGNEIQAASGEANRLQLASKLKSQDKIDDLAAFVAILILRQP